MGEYIDRELALKAILSVPGGNWKSIRYANEIKAIDSADVELVRHGTWVYDPNAMDYNLGGWVCSVCGVRNNNIASMPDIPPLRFAGSRYCPECGCRMEGWGE